MTPIKNYIKVEVTDDGDADAYTSELYVENTVQNPAWYTVEDNHVSLISENVEKVIKLETDRLDDCVWESRIEITKDDITDQNNVMLPLECQEIPDSTSSTRSIDLNQGSNKIFNCNICGKDFDLNYLLKQHLAEHKNQINYKTNQCKFCGKRFKFKIGLNRHIQKLHYNLCECKLCGLIIDKTNYNEHFKSHREDEAKVDIIIPNIKLRKFNGVWKSKTHVCNICFQTCDTENNFVEHMATHDNCQTQCNDCSQYVSVSEFTNHMLQIHNKNVFKCLMCNLQFDKHQHLKRHSINCLKATRTKWSKCHGKFKASAKTCSVCGIVFNNSLLLKNHKAGGCKNYSCKYCGKLFSTMKLWLKHKGVHEKDEQCVMSIVKTDIKTDCRQTEVLNNYSLNTNRENVTGRISLDQTDFMNSDESSAHILVVNNKNLNINKESTVCTPVGKRNSSYHVDSVDSNESITQNIRHDIATVNRNINLKEKKIISNIMERNNSDQMNIVNSNESNDSHNTVPSSSLSLNIKQEKGLLKNSSNQMNSNESTVSISPDNSIANDCLLLNIKQEKGLSTIVRESNDSDVIYLASNESVVSNASHDSVANNFPVLNIKQETNMYAYRTENSNQMDVVSSYESTVPNNQHNLVATKNPINLGNNIASTVRETPYFCIRKLPNIKNIFSNGNYDQTQDNIIFICRICKKSPSTDIHSFALHMSGHTECNMHECIVCDETFSTVLLWTNHMTNHEQQINLNLSPTVQLNTVETESNTFDPINSVNIEHQDCTGLSNKRIKKSTSNDSYACITSLNDSAKIIKKPFKRSSRTVTLSMNALEGHQNTLNSFPCRYCERIFSGKGQCTNHEKSHSKSGNLFLENNKNIIQHEAVIIPNYVSIEDNNIDSETISTEHKRSKRLSIKPTTYCDLCNRKFTKRCYYSNHMIIKHNINPSAQNKLINKSISLSEKLTNEYENQLSVPEDNNLNNYVNESNENKSPFCTVCKKHFAHFGALTNHMNIHSNVKPYKCQHCFRQFKKRSNFIIHKKKHLLKNEVEIVPSENKNSVKVEINEEQQIENCNDFLDGSFDGNSNSTNLTNVKQRLWFPCDVCEKKFSTPFQLNVHRNVHAGIKPYVCKICNKSYLKKYRWNWHLKGHYTKGKDNSKSKQQTDDNKSINGKLKIQSMCNLNTIRCQHCKKEYNMISQWKRHLTMNKECHRHCKSNVPEYTSNPAITNFKRSGPVKCNICLKTYSSSYNRNVHIATVHKKFDTTYLNTDENTDTPKDKILEIVQSKREIIKRKKSTHLNGTKCLLCNKMYSNRANLSRHMFIIHTKHYEPIACKYCKSSFKHKFSYREHLNSKHKKLLKIDENVKHTNNRTNLHIVPEHIKNKIEYFCKICKMKFADDIALQEHSNCHNIPTVDVYNCKDCGQEFETNVTLGKHILENHNADITTSNKDKHTENDKSQNASPQLVKNNPSQCIICLKILKDPGYLNEHMRLHSGAKPFKCKKCNMAFRFKSNLRSHEKKNLPCIP